MQPFEITLELDKVLARAAEFTSNETSRNMMLDTKPSSDLNDVRRETEKTDDALRLAMQYGTPPFSGFKDICNMVTRAASGARLSLRDLLDVADLLRQVQALHGWYGHCSESATSLDYLFSLVSPLDDLLTTLERSIVSEEELADGASATLGEIRRKLIKERANLRDTLDKMTRNKTMQKYLQDTTVTIRDGRFVLPVKAEYRSQVAGLIHDTSSSGATLFIEPMQIVEANNDIRLLESREVEEIAHTVTAESDRIMQKLCAAVGEQASTLRRLHATCAELNYYFAKANYAASLKAVKPAISDDGVIELKKARHPLLDQSKAVPISLELGEEHNALIVTGPNTGGKTVALKTVGLLTAMVMCGLMIPAGDNSKLSVFRRVLVDIGDEQSIEQSLSTFSAHMTNIIGILKKANSSTLALIDELGAGTDPVEGAALAISILEKLREKGAKIASTTHYAELKEFALRTEGIENGSCEFDIKTLRPTYRLLIGVPGKSNAFAISRRLGMDENVVIRAQELVSSDSRQFEDVVTKLESRRQSLEKQLENAQRLTQKANTEKQKAENELNKAKRQAQQELEQAKAEAEKIVSRTKAQAYALLDEMEKAKKAKSDSADSRAKLRREINKIEDSSNPVENKSAQDDYKLPRPLRIGDNVLIYDIDKDAVVLELPDKDDMVMVQAGIIKTRVKLKNLRLKKADAKKAPDYKNRRRTATANVDIKAATEVDVRGQTAIEAIMAVDSAIDSAILSNIETLTIIHGKGTGVLRKEIQKHLRSVKYVKSFRLGTFGEGESGVTIVTLK